MKKFVFVAVGVLTTTILTAAFGIIYIINSQDKNIMKIQIVTSPDNPKIISVSVTRQQIYRDIAPLEIEDFLLQTKIVGLKGAGLKLIDFKNNSLLAKYGFKKGDIIKEIAGTDVDTIEEAIRACEVVEKDIFTSKDEKDIDVKLVRGGEDLDMNLKIPPFVPENVYYTMTLRKRGVKDE